tara:strand:+ start:297 stop:545 length:249 start_codon:yes stop_codon:yes gene_type:complete
MVYGHGIGTPNPIGNYSYEGSLIGAGNRVTNANSLEEGIAALQDMQYDLKNAELMNSIHFDYGVAGPRKTYEKSGKLLDGYV